MNTFEAHILFDPCTSENIIWFALFTQVDYTQRNTYCWHEDQLLSVARLAKILVLVNALETY